MSNELIEVPVLVNEVKTPDFPVGDEVVFNNFKFEVVENTGENLLLKPIGEVPPQEHPWMNRKERRRYEQAINRKNRQQFRAAYKFKGLMDKVPEDMLGEVEAKLDSHFNPKPQEPFTETNAVTPNDLMPVESE